MKKGGGFKAEVSSSLHGNTGPQAALNSVSFDCSCIPWKPTAFIALKKYLEASNLRVRAGFSFPSAAPLDFGW